MHILKGSLKRKCKFKLWSTSRTVSRTRFGADGLLLIFERFDWLFIEVWYSMIHDFGTILATTSTDVLRFSAKDKSSAKPTLGKTFDFLSRHRPTSRKTSLVSFKRPTNQIIFETFLGAICIDVLHLIQCTVATTATLYMEHELCMRLLFVQHTLKSHVALSF